MNTILVVEDYSDICSLKFTLEQNGYIHRNVNNTINVNKGSTFTLTIKEKV